MPDETITQQESLALIESMINKAKNRFSENGFLYLLWGWVILFCSLGQFVLLYIVHYPKYYLVWTSTWLALIVQAVYLYKRKKKARVSTYTHEIVGYVWIAFVILMFILGFVVGRMVGTQYYMFANVVFLALYGMPTFLSGIILRFRPLIIGGISCWVLSVIASFTTFQFQLLFLAAGVVIAWIIPGYLLRSRFKQENQ